MSEKIRFTNDGTSYPVWEEKKLGEILSLGKSGGTPKSDNQSYYNGNINFLGISDITKAGKYVSKTEKTITEEGLDNSSAWVIPTGCLLYAMYASVGKVAISKTPMAISQAVFAMKLKDNCSLEYLYQYFTHFQSNGLKAYITTGTQGNINANTLKNFFIPLPSFLEQQKIAGLLSALDESISVETQALELFKEQKKGYLQKLFSQELRFRDGNGRMFPDWEEGKLGEVADFVNGFAFKPDDLEDEGTPVVKIKELLDPSILSVRTKITIPESLHLEDGDIIFSWSMTLACRVWKHGPAFLNQHLYKVNPINGNNAKFILALLTRELPNLRNLMHGGTAKHITRKDLIPYKVALPSLPEQQKIANFLSTLDDRIELQQEKVSLLKEQKRGYLQGIFG